MDTHSDDATSSLLNAYYVQVTCIIVHEKDNVISIIQKGELRLAG